MHVTMKYKKKLRLLVTNQCSRNCYYCHNEGMEKQPAEHLSIDLLEPFLSDIKRYTNRVVLSGGEPFEYLYLEELIDVLYMNGFDISLISANIQEKRLYTFGYKLKNLHYSIHSIQSIDMDAQVITRISKSLPQIKLSINIPFSDIKPIIHNWDRIYRLAKEVGANLQLIRIFIQESTALSCTRWEERWREMESFLEPFSSFLEATERESRYITKDSVNIDLLDIPCRASGMEFQDGACLENSDITISPDLSVSLCRWGNNSVPLYNGDIQRSFDEVILETTKKSCQNCHYGVLNNYIHNGEIDYYLNAPHYTWPKSDICYSDVLSKVSFRDLSYYGRSGNIARLESNFCAFLGCTYALAVNSGTAAVYLAILALELKPSDEIIMPVATFPSLVGAAKLSGANVRLCDIDSLSGNISPKSFRETVTPCSKAVIITHMWGYPADMEEIIEICTENHIYIIEDCSHAYGAEYDGKKVGTYGDIACFSMQANKSVFAGEGGILATNNMRLYENAVLFSSSVQRILDSVKSPTLLEYWGTGLGVKMKMNPLGAVLALQSLENLSHTNTARLVRLSLITDVAKRSGIFEIDSLRDSRKKWVYYTYKLVLKEEFIEDRDKILYTLIHAGLDAAESSFIPVHKQVLATFPFVKNGTATFPNADTYFKRIISLPAFVYEPISLVQYYADTIQQSVEKYLLYNEKCGNEIEDKT